MPMVTLSSVQTMPAPRKDVQSVSRDALVSLHGALHSWRASSQRPVEHAFESAHVAPAPPVANGGGVKQTKHGEPAHVEGPPQRAVELMLVHAVSEVHTVGTWHVPPTHVSRPRQVPPLQQD